MAGKTQAEVGIVVPTIWGRPQYIKQTLESIRQAGSAYVLLVGRPGQDVSDWLSAGLIDEYRDEAAGSLPAKLNAAFKSLPESVRYINWIGDDDLYVAGAIDSALQILKQSTETVLVYGDCEYIDSAGNHLFLNKAGTLAKKILKFGPDLIPQPGALYKRNAFEAVGGLREDLAMAFDFDLWIKLSRIGKIEYVSKPLSRFRWHPDSLSVMRRGQSVREASQVRVDHLPAALMPISFVWEIPVRLATFLAGKLVALRSRLIAQTAK